MSFLRLYTEGSIILKQLKGQVLCLYIVLVSDPEIHSGFYQECDLLESGDV